MAVNDTRQRPLRDLRISVTDRCNFRCRYCMPLEIFGAGYEFLPHAEILTFEEIESVAQAAASLGVSKLRLTGGEPLLRRNLTYLIGRLAQIEGITDLAMTTNGVLLPKHAPALHEAGLQRVTVSLDAMDDEIFGRMNGVGAKVAKVCAGIEAALEAGLGVKVNAVIKRGTNECQIIPLARKCREWGIPVRFIEYMDVGSENAWQMDEVVSADEMLEVLKGEFTLEEEAFDPTLTSRRWRHRDGRGEVGFIASVTQAFCSGCGRLRLSADGQIYTCLFATAGRDVKSVLRQPGATQQDIGEVLAGRWRERDDRYSELRAGTSGSAGGEKKVSMSYIGG